jgi:hypothetical protein
MADKSSKNSKNLTEDENLEEEVTLDSEGAESEEGLSTEIEEEESVDEKTKKGFQRLVARKDDELKTLSEQLVEANKKAAQFEKEQRDKKLSELSETDKWKALAEENAAKAAKAEISVFVNQQLSERNLMKNPIAEILLETPWSVPAIRKHLSPEPTWEETIEAVRTFLPSYLDTLVVPLETVSVSEKETIEPSQEEEAEPSMGTERNAPVVTKKRIWTRKEISELSRNPEVYLKYQREITQALAEGRVRE